MLVWALVCSTCEYMCLHACVCVCVLGCSEAAPAGCSFVWEPLLVMTSLSARAVRPDACAITLAVECTPMRCHALTFVSGCVRGSTARDGEGKWYINKRAPLQRGGFPTALASCRSPNLYTCAHSCRLCGVTSSRKGFQRPTDMPPLLRWVHVTPALVRVLQLHRAAPVRSLQPPSALTVRNESPVECYPCHDLTYVRKETLLDLWSLR